MQAVIMAAGKSTRTFPLTVTRPKALLPVLNRPVLEHQLEALEGLVESVVLVVGYRREMIEARFGHAFRGIPLTYVEQTEQLGTGHAVLTCAPFIEGPFLAMNGDDLYAAADLARVAAAGRAALAMRVEDPRLYGIYETDAAGRVIRLVEKPREVFSNLANIGVYSFTPEIFPILEATPLSERGEIEITSAVQTLAEREVFRVVESEGYWLPIGYPWHLLEVNAYFFDHCFEPRIEGEVSPAAHLSGAVSIGAGSVVRAGVVIDGPVIIGRECSIGPNCWIRPYTAIGDGCRVGQASEIKNSILFEGAHACHQNYVGDSVIGARVNLGCGTNIANVRHDGATHRSMVKGVLVETGRRKLGAVLGDDVHTGINTAIYPGRKMWPGSSTLPGGVVDRDVMGEFEE